MARETRKSRAHTGLTAEDILRTLKANASPENVAGMARYGIKPEKNYGVCTPVLTEIAERVQGNHELALELWTSGIRDARLVACFMDDPDQVTEEQMDDWVEDFNSWDVCDGCCLHLFSWSKNAHKKAREWSGREEEYVKRAGYVMMATLAVHDKAAPNGQFEAYFPLIVKGATDERNYVKKAVNWALRQIGKRNLALNKEAVVLAKRIQKMDSKSAKWIASDAFRELTNEKTLQRLKKKSAT
jgi:3-methyladenine DNA glycosylase AlkD